jgi:oxygen-independent coproporphyrinogen-3 oxidase
MKCAGYEIDLDIFRRYAGQALPRHVAYPMPTWWEDCTESDALTLLRESRERDGGRDLSLYLHVPFCERVCRYCACTRIPSPKNAADANAKTDAYVKSLLRELAALSAALGVRQTARQIHWGGGTPTYLSCDRLQRVHEAVRERFDIASNAEVAIELDPRVTTEEMLKMLRRLGFTRVSLGVQDFDPEVQQHVGRIQPFTLVRDMVTRCRDLGFRSVNFDLIYGLPLQTLETVERTLGKVIELQPDRIAYYQFAQIPDKIAEQRGLDYERLPDSELKLRMFLVGARRLTDAGYEFIGLDHFARPDEPLAQAHRDGTLQRNFQGMTTGGGLDLIGVGASSISHLRHLAFLQNVRDNSEYNERLGHGHLPTFRRKRFSPDDIIRQTVLADLYCYGAIKPAKIAAEFDIDFDGYFARELKIMQELSEHGLVTRGADGTISATMPLGRVLLRTVAAVFDAYLAPDAYRAGDRQYFSANA